MPQFYSFIYGLSLEIWRTFDSASLYILIGLLVSGLIHAFIRQEDIVRYLGQGRFRPVFLAALFGIPLPLCSCGVIPAAMSLRKSGASKGAILSFLISTPETGLDSIALSLALLNPVIAIFRPLAALVTAIVAGLSEVMFDQTNNNIELEKPIKSCCSTHMHAQVKRMGLMERLTQGLRYAFVDLLKDIAGWLVLGIVTAGIISYFIPETLISNYLGTGWVSMVVMLLIGIPLYVCASASTPIAAALILKGLSPGAALVFLLAGPATNPATIMMSIKYLGKRATVIYLASIAICALAAGYLLNMFYAATQLNATAGIGQGFLNVSHHMKTYAAYVLIGLIVYVFWPKESHETAS